MIILIDGYNFLKLITGAQFISESQMRDWMHYFERYIYYRGNQIIVVLDAGPYLFASSERYGAVEVWYAGQHQTADDWIKNWLIKNRQKDILLVSSDREVCDWADDLGIISIRSQDFYVILKNVIQQQDLQQEIQVQSLHKTKSHEDSDSYLDSLMEIGTKNIISVDKEDVYTQEIKSTLKHRQNSKTDKIFLKKINKI